MGKWVDIPCDCCGGTGSHNTDCTTFICVKCDGSGSTARKVDMVIDRQSPKGRHRRGRHRR